MSAAAPPPLAVAFVTGFMKLIMAHRRVAQLGSASGSGPEGRRFKSCHADDGRASREMATAPASKPGWANPRRSSTLLPSAFRYDVEMRKCERCKAPTRNRRFCSRRCSAIVVNHEQPKKKPRLKRPCSHCGLATINDVYCSRSCTGAAQAKTAREARALRPKRTKPAYVPADTITSTERAALLLKQGGVCAICKRDRPLRLDHCHTTGKVRGLLCGTCNTGIGSLGDTAEGVYAAYLYLESNRMA